MEALYTFDPLTTELTNSTWTYGMMVIVIGLLLAFFSQKKVAKSQRLYKQILLMLGFFAFMILLGTTFFTWLDLCKNNNGDYYEGNDRNALWRCKIR